MSRHIPIAQSRSGVLVLPSCSKSEGPFTCLECAGDLILRQGSVNVFHFAHRHLSPTCSGGGESARHKTAKLLIEKYCSRFVFRGQCVTRAHGLSRQYTDSCAQHEYRYDQHKNYSADVAIFQKGVIKSIVEVRVSHATTGDALQSRTAWVGANNVWEISVMDVLDQQKELFTTTNTVEVRSLLGYELDECTPVCHRRVLEAEELVEITRLQEIYRTTRPCSDCGVLGLDAVTRQASDTKTGYLCANCCRKCPSCDEYMSTGKTGCCASCSRRWDEWNKRWAYLRQNSLEKRKNRSLCILAAVFKRYSIYLSWKRRRLLRIIAPVLKRYAVFVVCKRRLYSCFRAHSYHKAAEHLKSIPKWKEARHFRALVAHEWSRWINSLVLKFEFVAAERLLLNPLAVVEEPVLAELKGILISRVRASLVLKRLLRKSLLYVRWTVRKKRVHDMQRMYRQYQRWVRPCVVDATVTKAPDKRGAGTRLITEYFGQPKRTKVA